MLGIFRNEAAILAARKDKDIIERPELMEALKRVSEMLGAVLAYLSDLLESKHLADVSAERTQMASTEQRGGWNPLLACQILMPVWKCSW